MATARDAFLWAHTGEVMALLANVQRADKNDRIWTRNDFDPHAPKPKMRRTSNPDEVL